MSTASLSPLDPRRAMLGLVGWFALWWGWLLGEMRCGGDGYWVKCVVVGMGIGWFETASPHVSRGAKTEARCARVSPGFTVRAFEGFACV